MTSSETEIEKDDKLVPELKVNSTTEEILDELQGETVPDRQITSLIDKLTRKYLNQILKYSNFGLLIFKFLHFGKKLSFRPSWTP